MCLESIGAVAVGAGPWLFAVEVAAAAPRVCVLHLDEIEVLLPIRTFFRERRRAVAHLHPLNAVIVVLARGVHVAEILVARDRSVAERAAVNRAVERRAATRLHARGDEVAHGSIVQ